jgi:hypothetical protein
MSAGTFFLVLLLVCAWTVVVAGMPEKDRRSVAHFTMALASAIVVGSIAGEAFAEVIRHVDPHHYEGEYDRYGWSIRIGVGALVYVLVAKPWKPVT